MDSIDSRLNALRKAMTNRGVDALIIPSNDPHQSEYVADHWKSREYFSGFTGSAGYLVVLMDYAALFTDSRYFLQAESELKGTEVRLHKQIVPHAPEHVNWLEENLDSGSSVGIEGLLFSVNQVDHLKSILGKKKIEIKNADGILDEVWDNRPSMPDTMAFEHEVQYAGLSREQKLELIRKEMGESDYYLVSALDEIAWALNVRAMDIDFTPVVLSYMLVSKNSVQWFINSDKVSDELAAKLNSENIYLLPYRQISDVIGMISQKKNLFVNLDGLSWTLNISIKCKKRSGGSLIQMLKAVKNPTEIGHIKNAMAKDGAALTHLYMWLENTLKERNIKETEVAQKLAFFRSQQPLYKCESFGAIVGYKSNGAIVHYSAKEESCAEIRNEGMLLIDSGGQYLDGTTDITRTICLDEPTDEQKKNFTLVLKGNIALQTICFPENTTGMQLDTLARMHLWNERLNYGHGTGHGVGFFSLVHEPPQGFVPNASTSRGLTVHIPGMITSNEPGFYKTGEYGIRIENLILCVKDAETKYGNFLRFEALTMFPIDSKLMDMDILTNDEIVWINDYHQKVYESISPLLNEEELDWLKEKCKPI